MTLTTCDRIPIPAPKASVADLVAAIFSQLPDRDALRIFRAMSMRWSEYSDHADIDEAIDRMACELAHEEGWEGYDLTARYLEDGK